MPFNLSPSRGFDTSARARFTNKACRINMLFKFDFCMSDVTALIGVTLSGSGNATSVFTFT